MITTTEEIIVDTDSNNNVPISSSEGAQVSEPARSDCHQSFDPNSALMASPARTTPQSALLDTLEQLLPRFVILPKYAAETLALWIVHTYCFSFRDVSTYIGVESPEKRCGKTTLLGVLSKLVHRPVVASNISPSAFFRVIEELQPTLLIDEADTFLQGNDELRGILNAGYHKPSAYVIRVSSEPRSNNEKKVGTLEGSRPSATASQKFDSQEKEIPMGTTWKSSLPSTNSPQQSTSLATYSTWCPKFIAAIGHLPETLADRCIVIRMQRKGEGEECERMRDLGGTDLREQCARFATEHGDAIAKAKPEIPKALNDRAADIWEPLFVIADIAGGDWPEKARAAAIALTIRAQESSPNGSLLFDIMYLFKYVFKKDRVFTEDLVTMLNDRHFYDRPWREARNGKTVTEIWLSKQLKPYGVRPKTVRLDGKIQKGYDLADLQQAFRYIPRLEFENLKADVIAINADERASATENAVPDAG